MNDKTEQNRAGLNKEEQIEKLRKTALAAGFDAVAVVSTDDIVFRPEYRKFCEENLCGNYGKNYACPPYCGTTEEMAEKIRRFRYAAVFQTKTEHCDAFDGAQIKSLKKKHIAMTLQTIKKFDHEAIENGTFRAEASAFAGLPIMAGPCNFCDHCRMPAGEVCLHPEQCFSCLSAYCIDVTHLADVCGMEISWRSDSVQLFSLYCFDAR